MPDNLLWTVETNKEKFNFIIVGGGLAGCLALHSIHHFFPDAKILLIEKNSQLCGSHTWSFHGTDVLPGQKIWLDPLISKSWEGYSVFFPEYSRQMQSSYHSIRSHDLAQKTLALKNPNIHLVFNGKAAPLSPTEVNFGGQIIQADYVIDASGWMPNDGPKGFQKFVGLEVELLSPHHLSQPILKDVRIPQLNAYRFMYVLPWDERRLLIEDTYYSDTPELAREKIEEEILGYARKHKWEIKQVLGHEQGSLPLNLSATRNDFNSISLGAISNYYQPVTGYTTPQLLESLQWLMPHLTHKKQAGEILELQLKWLRSKKVRMTMYLFLNRMLFLSADPSERYKILQRFYRLPEEIIHRFYSGRSSRWDFFRILCGKPPISLLRLPKVFKN